MKELFKAKKGLFIGIGAAAVAAVVAIVLIVNLNKKDSYRTITVHELSGTCTIKSADAIPENAFVGKNLKNGDDVTVGSGASMTLLLDSDKYIYAESNAHFWIEATGSEGHTKSSIHTDKGDSLHSIEKKLGSDEEYNVVTPSSVMSVRGTTYWVNIFIGDDGKIYSTVQVYSGVVEVTLLDDKGNKTDRSAYVNPGMSATTYTDGTKFDFVYGGDSGLENVLPIDYAKIPQNIALDLGKIIDNGNTLSITKELLFDVTEITSHQYEEIIIKEASCTEDGEGEEICTVCGDSKGKYVIAAAGHTEEIKVTEGSTCVEGVTTEKSCSVCGADLGTEIVKGDHSFGDWKETKASTCIADGAEERVCTVCGEAETRVAKATGHKFGEYVTVTAAGCESEGSEKHTCSVCGLEETKVVPAKGHTDVVTVVSEAGCVTTGTQDKICAVCGRTVVGEVIPAKGHRFGAWFAYDGVENCVHPGYYMRVCEVEGCGVDETKTVDPLPHKYTHCSHDAAELEDGTSVMYCIRECSECGDWDEGSRVRISLGGTCPYCGTVPPY